MQRGAYVGWGVGHTRRPGCQAFPALLGLSSIICSSESCAKQVGDEMRAGHEPLLPKLPMSIRWRENSALAMRSDSPEAPAGLTAWVCSAQEQTHQTNKGPSSQVPCWSGWDKVPAISKPRTVTDGPDSLVCHSRPFMCGLASPPCSCTLCPGQRNISRLATVSD